LAYAQPRREGSNPPGGVNRFFECVHTRIITLRDSIVNTRRVCSVLGRLG
jgi:hypothetical protein